VDDELPRVTLSMLRRADTMCPRRLAHEHASGRKLSPLGDTGFEVSNRIVEDAILWHKSGIADTDERVAFPDPPGVAPEQRALYRALARGYRATFSDAGIEVEVADLGWSTDIEDVGVRLVGTVGIALVRNGEHEIRLPRVARAGALLDPADLHFVVLRAAAWAPDRLRVVGFDSLQMQSIEYEIDVADRTAAAHAWLVERVAVIRTRAHPRRTIAGGDCRHCACIPGCPQVTRQA